VFAVFAVTVQPLRILMWHLTWSWLISIRGFFCWRLAYIIAVYWLKINTYVELNLWPWWTSVCTKVSWCQYVISVMARIVIGGQESL